MFLVRMCTNKNGSAERKHHHIVEVGLSLLAQASMPLKIWDEAFLTATYLINRTPSRVIEFSTPLTHLFHQPPNYNFLHIFGCACWPNLRPYNNCKLHSDPRNVLFLAIVPFIRDTSAWIFLRAVFIFLGMLSLMRISSSFPHFIRCSSSIRNYLVTL